MIGCNAMPNRRGVVSHSERGLRPRLRDEVLKLGT